MPIQKLVEKLEQIRDYESLIKEIAINPYFMFDDSGLSRQSQRTFTFTPYSPEAHHHFGKVLRDEGFYFHAHLLFDKGLRLEVKPSDDEFDDPNLHRRFHWDLWGLIRAIQSDKRNPQTLEELGFPMKSLPFEFGGEEQGYILPNFQYNSFNQNHDDDFKFAKNMKEGIRISKERKLGTIHHTLGCLAKIDRHLHLANNCPYLKYVEKTSKHEL